MGCTNACATTVNSVVTAYLNDLQPGLVKVLNSESNGDTTRYQLSVRQVVHTTPKNVRNVVQKTPSSPAALRLASVHPAEAFRRTRKVRRGAARERGTSAPTGA